MVTSFETCALVDIDVSIQVRVDPENRCCVLSLFDKRLIVYPLGKLDAANDDDEGSTVARESSGIWASEPYVIELRTQNARIARTLVPYHLTRICTHTHTHKTPTLLLVPQLR
jgi:hypothetical protein